MKKSIILLNVLFAVVGTVVLLGSLQAQPRADEPNAIQQILNGISNQTCTVTIEWCRTVIVSLNHCVERCGLTHHCVNGPDFSYIVEVDVACTGSIASSGPSGLDPAAAQEIDLNGGR